MTTVGARELKHHLGRYLRQVQAGETILVTKRGCPVACGQQHRCYPSSRMNRKLPTKKTS